ncbi:substrate-binding domain-containing protein [Streptomyces sp. MS06]|uniref:substrate-binding domain-containing protein n=1 Tax=Streptomyces sp. MS06 TaxID=3385974 RepID=UPI0039A38275
MEWLSAENVVAVGTAVLGIAASGVMVWYERRVPRRKRIGYRIQMDNPIGGGVRSGRPNRRLGLFDEIAGMADATLVLLRIENDGWLGVARDDYTGPERHGLTAVFTGRTVRGVSVTQPTDTDHLMDHFTAERGFGFEANRLRVPRVPLNRGEHFKLLVLLSGGDVGNEVRLIGGLSEGEVHPNRSTTLDDRAPLFSRPARTIGVLLAVCVVALAALVVAHDDTPPPLGCAKGTLTVVGSTAFAPVAREAAEKYERDCPGSSITVDPHGSTTGVRALAATGARTGKGAPAMVALSDGPKPDGLPELRENRVAVSVFTLVVNKDAGVTGLSTEQVRKLYRGGVTDWRELGGADLPVRLVSRDAGSGTRRVFQRRVLDRGEIANSSADCLHRDDPAVPVVRCELNSTEQVLTMVAGTSGAIGYSELNLAEQAKDRLHLVSLDGHEASVDDLEHGDSAYPYREVEYAYTYGRPPADSLASGFLAYLTRGDGQAVIRTHGHVPCWTPEGLRLCGQDTPGDLTAPSAPAPDAG